MVGRKLALLGLLYEAFNDALVAAKLILDILILPEDLPVSVELKKLKFFALQLLCIIFSPSDSGVELMLDIFIPG